MQKVELNKSWEKGGIYMVTRKFLTRLLSTVMVLAVTLAMSSGTTVLAAENNNSDSFEFVEISDEELEATTLENKNANIVEREYNGDSYSVTNSISVCGENEDEVTNTNPNYAYLVTNDIIVQGAIETNSEMRWYGFNLAEASKVTILLQMVESLDADIYMFALNQETYELELYGGSANEGVGITEYYNAVMDAGTYYFAISGYEGTGAFAFAYYQSSADVSKEINDSATTATPVSLDSSVTGVIDNPNDVDYYKFTVTQPTIIKYSISSSNGYSLLYAGKSGNSAAIYIVNSNTGSYQIMPGTYYFAVISENGTYSATSTYTANFIEVGSMSGDSAVTLIGISENAGIVYETNDTGTVNYVNGNPVDISYSYVQNLSNSAGTQSYDISIDANAGARVLLSGVYEPAAVHYYSSTKPAMKVSSRPALMLTFYGDSNFYRIHCTGSGEYSMNTLREDLNNVTVLIDPETGKLIDIVEFNYYYDFAPVGTNYITWTRSYTMTYYGN